MKLFTPKKIQEADRKVLDELLRRENAAADALKAKVAKLNQIDSEYEPKIAAKRQELQELEQRAKERTNGLEATILVLEERRRSALLPVTEERDALEKTRQQVEEVIRKLDEEREAVKAARQELSAKDAELRITVQTVEKMQTDVISMLDQRRREADASVVLAEISIQRFKEEERRIADLRSALKEKEASACSAEELAKAAMLRTDDRIKKEQVEQRKTDDKRKMLKVALEVLKKKEIWLKQHETKTK